MIFSLLLQRAGPDPRFLFFVNLAVLAGVIVFSVGIISLILARSYRRRVEEEKMAAVGNATARILHQIKNPLQSVVLHAELLHDQRSSATDEARREIRDAILSESERLVTMLAELSEYVSGTARQLSSEPFPLHALVSEVVHQEEVEMRAEGVELSATLEEVVVRGDPYYLRQALDNLVRNARQILSGRPDPRVTIRLARSGRHVRVEVEDNGPGVPPGQLGEIFTPFVSGKGGGMGLGLPIAREIVEKHGGRLEASSQLEIGTTFVILLPLDSNAEPA